VALWCGVHLHATAEPVSVRHVQGTLHGFLELRAGDGSSVASGDSTQVVHGDQVTARTLFHFKDGSIDDELTVFSQRRKFHLISYRHIQKGQSFPHPMDVMIDCAKRQVEVRTPGKDGKEETKTEHVDLPPDLANGMVPIILENLAPGTAEMSAPMLVASPKPRIVKLIISPSGEDPVSIGGSSRRATHYEIKIDLKGLAGVVAPLIGKQPPNIQIWVLDGPAPVFLREEGPVYPEGPMMTIQLASPVWPRSSRSATNK
jgi:hypothetical protein